MTAPIDHGQTLRLPFLLLLCNLLLAIWNYTIPGLW